MNQVQLIGRLTRDPELGATAGGKPVCDMRLAVPRRDRDADPVYVDLVAYDALAETCAVHLEKGRQVAVTGRLDSVGSGLGRFDGMRLTLNTAANEVFYKHIRRWAPGIRPGARVKRGQLLGYSWSANGVPHLHIAVRHGNPKVLFGISDPARSSRA